MISAIHIKWKKLRPDLRHDNDALRDERLAFITDTLKLKRTLNSMRELTNRQLGLVLDAMTRLESQPQLPDESFRRASANPKSEAEEGQVIHLASSEQVHVIHKLLDYLGWGTEAREKFIKQRFNRSTPAMLSPKDAHSLIMILLYIAAARSIKERGNAGKRVSRAQINAEIPALKERLGIDRKQEVEL
jgi:hypothetical protein